MQCIMSADCKMEVYSTAVEIEVKNLSLSWAVVKSLRAGIWVSIIHMHCENYVAIFYILSGWG